MSDVTTDFPNVRFGTLEAADVAWEDAPDPDPDDEELSPTPDDVVAMLGFDPADDAGGLDKAYNPDQPRDSHGRWSPDGGAGDAGVETGKPWGHFKDREEAEGYVRSVASSKGYDPEKVEVSNEDRKFTLNGQQWSYAGAAYIKTGGDRPKGTIVIYPNHIAEGHVGEVIAHEVMHQKFQSAMDRYARDQQEITHKYDEQTNQGVKAKDRILDLHGNLRPQYADQYPAFARLAPVLSSSEKLGELQRSDGVSDYSREWWKAANEGKADKLQAVHETLAEMATNEHVVGGEKRFLDPTDPYSGEKSATGGAKVWRDLYGTVNKLWRSRNK